MATYALIHGAGDVGWYWHLVERELRARGHRTVAPDLPIDDEDSTLLDQARVVVDALASVRDGGELVVVGHSYGGYVAPIVAELTSADHLVLVAPMVPKPGESAEEMWEATGWHMPEGHAGTTAIFYHDVEAGLARSAIAHERAQAEATGHEPWPLDAWPTATTHVVICRDDRIFPADWLRDVVRERLSIEPDELPGGHTPALSRPGELVDLLESYRT